MEEMHEGRRSRLGRKGYIKRWLILVAVGVMVGIGQVLADTFLPVGIGSGLSVILLMLFGLPAAALLVVWTMHRATDAGKDEAWGLLVLVPIVNIVALVVFASLPSREDAES